MEVVDQVDFEAFAGEWLETIKKDEDPSDALREIYDLMITEFNSDTINENFLQFMHDCVLALLRRNNITDPETMRNIIEFLKAFLGATISIMPIGQWPTLVAAVQRMFTHDKYPIYVNASALGHSGHLQRQSGTLTDYIRFYEHSRGLYAIIDRIRGAAITELAYAGALAEIINKALAQMNEQTNVMYAGQVATAVEEMFTRLTDEDIKAVNKKDFSAFMTVVRHEICVDNMSGEIIDQVRLHLAVRFLKTSSLEKRLQGLNDIKDFVKSASEREHVLIRSDMDDNSDNGDDGFTIESKDLIRWLVEHNVLEYIFGPNIHLEVARRSGEIVRFLARESSLSESHLDTMWQICIGTHHRSTVHGVLTVLSDCVLDLKPLRLLFLYDKLAALPVHQFDQPTLLLTFKLSQAIAMAIIQHDELTSFEGSNEDLPKAIVQPPMPLSAEHSQGADILWKIVHDTSTPGLSRDVVFQAHTHLINYIVWTPLQSHRFFLLTQCLEVLSDHKVPSTCAVVYLAKIIGSMATGGKVSRQFNTIQTVPVDVTLQRLVQEYQLPNMLLGDFQFYKAAARSAVESSAPQLLGDLNHAFLFGQLAHLDSIKFRWDLLAFCVEHSREGFLTSYDQIDLLWKITVTDALTSEESDHSLSKFQSEASSSKITDLVQYMFNKHLKELDPRNLSKTGYQFLQYTFATTNWHREKAYAEVEGKPHIQGPLVGLETIWKVPLMCRNEDVAKDAATFLVALYINLAPEIQEQIGPKSREFVDTCMTQLQNATVALRSFSESVSAKMDSTGSPMVLPTSSSTFERIVSETEATQVANRCLLLLQRFMEQFSTRHSALVSAAGLRRHSTLGRGTPLTLVIKLFEGGTHHLKTHLKETVLGIRQRIANEIKRTNVEVIRMIDRGKELSAVMNDRTLAEINCFDGLAITVLYKKSIVSNEGKPVAEASAESVAALRPFMPAIVLTDKYVDDLFQLLVSQDQFVSRVWDLLMSLPTDPNLLAGLRDLTAFKPTDVSAKPLHWSKWLQPSNTFRLLYALQVISALISEETTDDMPTGVSWSERFIQAGGAAHLCTVLLQFDWKRLQSQQLGNQCLVLLLQMISSLVLDQSTKKVKAVETWVTPLVQSAVFPASTLKNAVADIQTLLASLLVDLATATSETAAFFQLDIDEDYQVATDASPAAKPTAAAAKPHSAAPLDVSASLVKTALSLAAAVSVQSPEALASFLKPHVVTKGILLASPSQHVRRAVSELLQEFASSSTSSSPVFLALLQQLLQLFVGSITTPTYTHSAKEYFALLESMLNEYFDGLKRAGGSLASSTLLDVNVFLEDLISRISSHGHIEITLAQSEDTVLQGYLSLASTLFQHFPSLHETSPSLELLKTVHDRCLFGEDVPLESLDPATTPICRRPATRQVAFGLLAILCQNRACLEQMVRSLVSKHTNGEEKNALWNYSPRNQERSSCGYVGLVNQGATCYMNSIMQQFFMIPNFRKALLEAPVPESIANNETAMQDSIVLQLQTMFTYLQESEKRAYDTLPFCMSFKDYDGNVMNTKVQMDVDEFFNMLFDRLENLLKGTDAVKTIFQDTFGGKLIQQIKSLECPHVSSREEPFSALQCDIKNKKSILESLQTYVKGEMLDGDNKYFCAQCQKHVNALKRACVYKLPNTLILHLKRFEFDMEQLKRFKINDYCEFPLELNMEPYTSEYISAHDDLPTEAGAAAGETPSSSIASPPAGNNGCTYQLVGILVHTGTADSGHYYSFIKERRARPGHAEPEWIQFNDSLTERFSPNDINAQCFGGSEYTVSYDQNEGRNTARWQVKPYSAYMLFYDLVRDSPPVVGSALSSATTPMQSPPPPVSSAAATGIGEVGPAATSTAGPVASSSILRSLRQNIIASNREFIKDQCIFDARNFQFVWSVAELAEAASTATDATPAAVIDGPRPAALSPLQLQPQASLGEQAAQMGTLFVFNTLAHAKERTELSRWMAYLRQEYSQSAALCRWLLFGVVSDPRWLLQHFLHSYVKESQHAFADLISVAVRTLRPIESLSAATEAPYARYLLPAEAAAKGVPPSAIGALLDVLLDLLLVAPLHWRYMETLCQLLHQQGTASSHDIYYLISRGAIGRICAFCMGQECPQERVLGPLPASPASAAWKPLPLAQRRVGDAFSSPPAGSLISLAAALLAQVDLKASIAKLGPMERTSAVFTFKAKSAGNTLMVDALPSIGDNAMELGSSGPVISVADVFLLFGPAALPPPQMAPTNGSSKKGHESVEMDTGDNGEVAAVGDAHAFLSRLVRDNFNLLATKDMIAYISMQWDDDLLLAEMVAMLVHGINNIKPESFGPYFEVIYHLLTLASASGATARVQLIMRALVESTDENVIYPRIAVEHVHFLQHFAFDLPPVRTYLLDNIMQWGPSWLLRGMHDSLADAAETLVKELMSLPMSSPAVSVHQQLPPPVIAPALSGAATDVPAPDANLLALVATAASQIMVPVAAPKPADQPDAPPGSPQATTAAEFIGPFLPAEPMTGVVSTPVKSPYSRQRQTDWEAHKQIIEALIEMLPIAIRLASPADQRVKVSTTHLVSYIKCLIACVQREEDQTTFYPHLNDVFKLYDKIDGHNIEKDENKREILNLLYKLMLNCPRNTLFFASDLTISRRVILCLVSLKSNDESYRYYNTVSTPVFYKILVLMCQAYEEFIPVLAAHDNFRWALDQMFFNTRDYPDIAIVLLELFKLCAAKSSTFRKVNIPKILSSRVLIPEAMFAKALDSLIISEVDIRLFFEQSGPAYTTMILLETMKTSNTLESFDVFLPCLQVFHRSLKYLVDSVNQPGARQDDFVLTMLAQAFRRWQNVKPFINCLFLLSDFRTNMEVRMAALGTLGQLCTFTVHPGVIDYTLDILYSDHEKWNRATSTRQLTATDAESLYKSEFSPLNSSNTVRHYQNLLEETSVVAYRMHWSSLLTDRSLFSYQDCVVIYDQVLSPYYDLCWLIIQSASEIDPPQPGLVYKALRLGFLLDREALQGCSDQVEEQHIIEPVRSVVLLASLLAEGGDIANAAGTFIATEQDVVLLVQSLWTAHRSTILLPNNACRRAVWALLEKLLPNLVNSNALDTMARASLSSIENLLRKDPLPSPAEINMAAADLILLKYTVTCKQDYEQAAQVIETITVLSQLVLGGTEAALSDNDLKAACAQVFSSGAAAVSGESAVVKDEQASSSSTDETTEVPPPSSSSSSSTSAAAVPSTVPE